MEMVGALLATFIFWKGASDVVNGIWSSGSFLALWPVPCPFTVPQNFAEMNAQIQFGAASAERLFELLDEVPNIQEIPNAKLLAPFTTDICL